MLYVPVTDLAMGIVPAYLHVKKAATLTFKRKGRWIVNVFMNGKEPFSINFLESSFFSLVFLEKI